MDKNSVARYIQEELVRRWDLSQVIKDRQGKVGERGKSR